MERIIDTGLKELIFNELRGGVTGGDVMPNILNSSVTSLTKLSLGDNPDWWKSGEAFPQFIVFLGRQTDLEVFHFYGNALTTSQTTELM